MGRLRKLKRSLKRKYMNQDSMDINEKIRIASDRVTSELRAEQNRKLEEFYDNEIMRHSGAMSMTMYFLFGIQLHRIYGFGAKRLSVLFQAVDDAMAGFTEGKISEEDMARVLYEETGIDYRS